MPHQSRPRPTGRQVLRLPEVQAEFCPMSESQIRNLMAQGSFPHCLPIGPRAVGWLRIELEQWRASMTAKRAEQIERRKEARQSARATA